MIFFLENITQGFPPVGPPPFSTDFNGKHYTFLEMIGELNTSIITLSFIIILEAVAIAKAFC